MVEEVERSSALDTDGGNMPVHVPTPVPTSLQRASNSSSLDNLQTTLGVVGLIPGLGIFADVANTAISIGRGNFGEAALNAKGASWSSGACAIEN